MNLRKRWIRKRNTAPVMKWPDRTGVKGLSSSTAVWFTITKRIRGILSTVWTNSEMEAVGWRKNWTVRKRSSAWKEEELNQKVTGLNKQLVETNTRLKHLEEDIRD